MIITTVHSRSAARRRSPWRGRSGFSLVELLIAMSLSVMIASVLMGAFLFIGRSTVAIYNYSEMNDQSRRGLEVLGRDLRAGAGVLSGYNENNFTVQVRQADGSLLNVTYNYSPNAPDSPLTRTANGETTTIMSSVDDLSFHYFNLQAEPASVPLEVKQIQLRLKLVRYVIGLENTEKVVSARYILRNKRVSE